MSSLDGREHVHGKGHHGDLEEEEERERENEEESGVNNGSNDEHLATTRFNHKMRLR